MTVNELLTALQTALDRGLPGETTVVLADEDTGAYTILSTTADPSDTGDYDMWFTLFSSGEEADCRFTTGGMP